MCLAIIEPSSAVQPQIRSHFNNHESEANGRSDRKEESKRDYDSSSARNRTYVPRDSYRKGGAHDSKSGHSGTTSAYRNDQRRERRPDDHSRRRSRSRDQEKGRVEQNSSRTTTTTKTILTIPPEHHIKDEDRRTRR